ncbi:flavodoxin [uncultured Alistipes sp.]|uniref:flavodoxin n=1 Tax=uncultured Alistipes sp. TaxID=538949 RepID=UPI00266DB6F2|nr:flavodoxin [uncultured Alistipes sp.]
MKKLFLIPWMLLTTLAVTTACGEPHPSSNEPEQTRPEDDGNDEEGGNVNEADGRYLVLYCSRTGNTERMARTIQSTLDCEMAEVEPAVPYDTDYNAMLDRAQTELEAIAQGDFPAITTSVESFDNYDIIFVGYPIWFGHMASPMQAFLHDHAALLAGKRIALFASSGSSGIGTSERDAAALVPEALFEESLLLTSGSLGSMATRIPAWLEELGAGREEH